MKQGFNEVLSARAADRRQVFAAATEKWPTTANLIEKDFIVCAVLNILFSDVGEGAGTFVFKGGTPYRKLMA